jgi:hypothetical protein
MAAFHSLSGHPATANGVIMPVTPPAVKQWKWLWTDEKGACPVFHQARITVRIVAIEFSLLFCVDDTTCKVPVPGSL